MTRALQTIDHRTTIDIPCPGGAYKARRFRPGTGRHKGTSVPAQFWRCRKMTHVVRHELVTCHRSEHLVDGAFFIADSDPAQVSTMKTTRSSFYDVARGTALFEVRPGVPIDEALEHADLLLDCAQSALVNLDTSEVISSESLHAIDFVLSAARALTQSVAKSAYAGKNGGEG